MNVGMILGNCDDCKIAIISNKFKKSKFKVQISNKSILIVVKKLNQSSLCRKYNMKCCSLLQFCVKITALYFAYYSKIIG